MQIIASIISMFLYRILKLNLSIVTCSPKHEAINTIKCPFTYWCQHQYKWNIQPSISYHHPSLTHMMICCVFQSSSQAYTHDMLCFPIIIYSYLSGFKWYTISTMWASWNSTSPKICIRIALYCVSSLLSTDLFYTYPLGLPHRPCSMMTSSNGTIFRVTGHLCGEFTGPRWIPHTKASDAELWCLLWSAPE